ncbi:hypothetical protein AB0O01_24525 [Streptomyces sp. NPDC093252]|uniref:hypothetical protein n=1 Tax=Streptomyces sp. NPDC093252 TaxID=3154980 RepID=UPI00341E50F2
MPVDLGALMLAHLPGTSDPRELGDAGHGEVWVEDGVPGSVAAPEDVACVLHDGHQGCRTFEYREAGGFECLAEGDPRGTP